MSNKDKVLTELKNKTLVKIISGIQNYDKQKTLFVSMAAEMGEATALDICDDKEIIKVVRASVELPLFVSSIDPKKLLQAQDLGADVLEVGNYESFYKEARLFTPKEILEITRTVKNSLYKNTLLSVTIPATLEVENQIKLGKELLNLGVEILQTEGFVSDIPTSDRNDKTYNDILRAASTLANTIELKKVLPSANIITSSGITPTTVPLALGLGVNGIGIGNYINSLFTQDEMTEKVKEIMDVVSGYAYQYIENPRTGKRVLVV